MLGRASKDYAARNPAAVASAKPRLEQALFPSSSPRDGSIADFCKTSAASPTGLPASTFRPRPQPASTVARPAVPVTAALHTRSPNIQSATMPSHGSRGLVTLCTKLGSFTEEPFSAGQSSAASSKVQQAADEDLLAYGIDPDDFTDDENLDLDLPARQPVVLAAAANKTGGGNPGTDTKTNIASDFSWASSSPSHLVPPPPPSRTTATSAAPAKRPSLESHVLSPLPIAKKRTMPKHWSKAADAETTLTDAGRRWTSTTAAAKSTPVQLWDASASALKAQKKQLKDYSKKPALAEGSASGLDSQARVPEKGSSVPESTPAKAAPIGLSSEQQRIKNLVCIKGASVFFTGPAGTGKSVLMRAIIKDLQRKFARDPESLGVTASTGLAACNIGGMTLHSFSGIGLGKEDVPILVKKIRRNPKAKARWINTKVLVIDEISMVDGDLFDKLSHIGRIIRNNGRPWGGIQLVLTGDFFQLPPVPDREKRDVKFAFDATTWATSIDHTIGLTQVFRQKDPEFAQMLNEMRLGQISDKTLEIFKSLSRPLTFDDNLEVTELFPTRNEVESSNERRLQALKGKPYRYDAMDSGPPDKRDSLLQNMMAPKSLVLRQGAQVMLIKNLDETLVNGTVGTVLKFMTESEFMSFGGDDLGESSDALSKKRALLLNKYLDGVDNNPGAPAYPYIQFHATDGSHRHILLRPEEWKVELPTGEVQAARTQLPLILAWALSIHKAQGQTLERVKVDLGRVFEKGQAYVALSRATSKAGLQVLRFEKSKVMAHPRVVEFYRNLYSVEQAMKIKGGNASILAYTRQEVEPKPLSVFNSKGSGVRTMKS